MDKISTWPGNYATIIMIAQFLTSAANVCINHLCRLKILRQNRYGNNELVEQKIIVFSDLVFERIWSNAEWNKIHTRLETTSRILLVCELTLSLNDNSSSSNSTVRFFQSISISSVSGWQTSSVVSSTSIVNCYMQIAVGIIQWNVTTLWFEFQHCKHQIFVTSHGSKHSCKIYKLPASNLRSLTKSRIFSFVVFRQASAGAPKTNTSDWCRFQWGNVRLNVIYYSYQTQVSLGSVCKISTAQMLCHDCFWTSDVVCQ